MDTIHAFDQLAPEPQPRSVGELKQLLGVTELFEVTTEEVAHPQAAAVFDVHEDTRDHATWKPEYYAATRTKIGQVRLKVTRAESEALLMAGAVPRPAT